MARLGDICTVVSGTTPSSNVPEYWNGDINWITPAEMTEESGIIFETQRKITELAVKKSGLTPFPAGTVLLSSRAPIGKVGIAGAEMYCNQGFKNLICSDVIFNKYLYWFLIHKREYLNALGRGATFKEISKSLVEGIEIPLPPFETQQTIASLLDKVDALISLRKKQLQKLDDLVKSRFVELFGDPETNPFRWDKVSIPAVMRDKASNGFFAKREDYVQDGNVSVLGVAYVVNRMYSQVENLPQTNATAQDIRKYSVKYGDMLFCRSSLVAEGIGKASIIPEDTPANVLFECHVIRIPLNLKICVPEFMQVQSTMDYFRKQMIAQSKTATMTTIGQDGIMKAKIILPPLEKQKVFYNFLKNVDKTKLTVQQGLDKLELLKQSLMQKYFGGEQ